MQTKKTSNRILIILFTLISFITLVYLYMGYLHHKFVLKTLVNQEKKIATKIYTNTFKHITHHYESIANSLLLREDVLEAFENQDREALLKSTQPLYKELLTQNPYLHIMHFHTKETKSFLRLHKPSKFGDDLSDIRHMINKVNSAKTKQIGMEVGRYGIYYRVALPVFNSSGKHLGAFEFGIDINYILNLFNTDYEFKPILLLHKNIFDIIFENNHDLKYQSFSDEYYVIKNGSNTFLDLLPLSILSSSYSFIDHNDSTYLGFEITELKSVLNEDIGQLMFIKNLDFYMDQVSFIEKTTITFSFIITLLSFYFLRRLFNTYMHTIDSYQNKIEIKNRSLSKLINIDHLTKTNNRKSIEGILQKEFKRAKRYHNPLSILILDIDDFKNINDTFGHNAGDKTLRDLVKVVLSNIRESDHFGRWGGEEFILVATETSVEEATILAEKIRQSIKAHVFSDSYEVTCSIGVAQYQNERDSDSLVHNADTALYEAKKQGKDKVVFYSD
ncbi:diguanylate cyclase [Campylobacterota bacterium]